MARKAREPAIALSEAGAGGQQQRLMARVPGVAQIGGLFGARLLAMARAAQSVQLGSVHAARVSRMHYAWIRGVRRRRPVADFAMHAQLRWNDGLVFRQLQVSGGMAGEASHHPGGGVEGPEGYSGVRLVAWGQRERIRGPVPGFAQFHIMFGIQPADEGDGLVPCPECPLSGLV
jgi:hypothetical protein